MKKLAVLPIILLALLTVGCPEPPEGENITVSLKKIEGVTIPVTGSVPVASITGSAEYTGSVVWAPSDSEFKAGTVYTATITLVPESGYTFNGIGENFFTVAGAVATNQENAGVINAEFPATEIVTSVIEPQAGDKESHTVDSVNFDMVYIPGGKTFTMGDSVTTPTQDVTLTGSFLLGETEVTQALWEAVRTSWPAGTPSPAGENYPAYLINWYDAVAFCNELTLADASISDNEVVYYSDEELTTVYTSGPTVYVDWNKTGYRLPSEAEWEYAARWIDGSSWNGAENVSGSTTSEIDQYAWHSENSGSAAHEVATKTANHLGLCDMSGNVREMCYDWFASYSGSSETDPRGPESGDNKICRGGVFNAGTTDLRCGHRFILDESDRDGQFGTTFTGFRLCRTVN